MLHTSHKRSFCLYLQIALIYSLTTDAAVVCLRLERAFMNSTPMTCSTITVRYFLLGLLGLAGKKIWNVKEAL